jgi:hypothetical protein
MVYILIHVEEEHVYKQHFRSTFPTMHHIKTFTNGQNWNQLHKCSKTNMNMQRTMHMYINITIRLRWQLA